MRIAVISDIHGNLSALDAVLADIASRGADLTVNLGDCLSGPLDGAGTADRLMELDLPTVMGNHDQWLIDRPFEEMGAWERPVHPHLSDAAKDWLGSMPATLEIEGLFFCHGTPASNRSNWLDINRGTSLRLAPHDEIEAAAEGIDAPVMFCGHTHQARTVRLRDGRLIVNPGSVGCPAYCDRRQNPPMIFTSGAPDARYAMVEYRNGTWRPDLVQVPYYPAPMIARARAAGEDDWAEALATGWLAP